VSGQRWLSLYDIARSFEMRRDHPRNRRHGGIDGSALPSSSILEFHPELKIEQQLVTADINKFFCVLWHFIHRRSLFDRKEQIMNNVRQRG
jgi:hypothetical protein